jgi:hypothetical protein
MSWLVDTDVLSERTKAKPNSRVLDWVRDNADKIYTSSHVIGELAAGIERLDFWGRSVMDKYENLFQMYFQSSNAPVNHQTMNKQERAKNPSLNEFFPDKMSVRSFLWQRPAQDAQEIGVGEIGDVLRAPAARSQQIAQFAHVGDGFQVARGLFAAETAVQIGAEADMACIAGDLTDVVNVLYQFFEPQVA